MSQLDISPTTIDIGPGGTDPQDFIKLSVPGLPPLEFAILSLSGSWNIAPDTELRYHKPCGVDIYLGDIKNNFSNTNISWETGWRLSCVHGLGSALKLVIHLKHSQLLSLLMP